MSSYVTEAPIEVAVWNQRGRLPLPRRRWLASGVFGGAFELDYALGIRTAMADLSARR